MTDTPSKMPPRINNMWVNPEGVLVQAPYLSKIEHAAAIEDQRQLYLKNWKEETAKYEEVIAAKDSEITDLMITLKEAEEKLSVAVEALEKIKYWKLPMTVVITQDACLEWATDTANKALKQIKTKNEDSSDK